MLGVRKRPFNHSSDTQTRVSAAFFTNGCYSKFQLHLCSHGVWARTEARKRVHNKYSYCTKLDIFDTNLPGLPASHTIFDSAQLVSERRYGSNTYFRTTCTSGSTSGKRIRTKVLPRVFRVMFQFDYLLIYRLFRYYLRR